MFQVNRVIDNSIKEYGVSVEAPFDPKMVKVVWIKYSPTFVRGFSGVNTVYANEKHFMMTHYSYEDVVRPEILDSLMIIDIANLLLHEYAHLKLRKVFHSLTTCFDVAHLNVISNSFFHCSTQTTSIRAPLFWRCLKIYPIATKNLEDLQRNWCLVPLSIGWRVWMSFHRNSLTGWLVQSREAKPYKKWKTCLNW